MTSTTSTVPALDPANPFATPSDLPYALPDFAAIRDEHYLPAFEAGMAEERAEVETIVTNPEPPTEENLLLELELSGALLDRVSTVFFSRTSADTTDALDALEEQLAPRLAEHHDAIYLDRRLHDRLEALQARVEAGEVTLPDDSAWLLHTLRRDVRRAGVALEEGAKTRLRELNARITSLETAFGRELLADTNASAVLLEDEADLEGLPEDAVAAARQAAQDRGHDTGWLVELMLYSQQPVLASLRRRDVRRRVHEASVRRGGHGGEHDTRAILLELALLRAERARLLGFDHHGAYVADDSTARTTEAVDGMLHRLAPAAAANARREAADLERALQADEPGATLEPWDWSFYAERVRQERYALDDALLRPYLELDRVLHDGVFHAATELYGITFTRRKDLVGYHHDVQVYEVHDADGTGIGLFLADWYTRASKRGGAWMNNLVDQSGLLGDLPVVMNNLNIPKPPADEPTLLSWDEVITMFHEFGHALHGLFSAVRLPSQSGTAVPRDFVEYPSQVNEMWAWEPSVLRRYAVHHETGEPMPEEWVGTMIASRQFNEGFSTTEYLAAALLDQAWHQLQADEVPTDVEEVEAFEARALEAAGVAVHAVPPRYRTTYFNHVFGGGYAAAYYSYIWSEVLDADTVEWFAENGGLLRETGDRFRQALLSRGGSLDVMDTFRELRGREPRIEPLLARRGLADGA
ncbi:M3 family metallopeptidase [Actinotalea sp. Marseille-Q4924]|uniref:M3 family metallopeptidase n=1 Tax=Actinotalea sp. Marseille-Q4924 TaxID=2866571 RepID=UPI001CE3D836|nr:M3 family metallopeptidase [Actinotalea sp. Marseille-Q4924]